MSNEALRKHAGLGPLLKAWRRQVRLTQQEVAEAVNSRRGSGMTANWYAKLENRENAYPSEEDLDHILEVLGRTRWEAERALGGDAAGELAALADASPEPQTPMPAWSAEVAAGPVARATPPASAAPPSAAASTPGSTVSPLGGAAPSPGSTVSRPTLSPPGGGSTVSRSPGPDEAAAAPRMLGSPAVHSAPPVPATDDDLRAALTRFGLSDEAAEEALAYARSLRARSQPSG